MTSPSTPALHLRQLSQIVWKHRRLWIVPAMLGLVSAAVYALIKPDVWEASQAVVLREEAGGEIRRQGQFEDAERMKSAQETIQEVVKNRSVVATALAEIGPPPGVDPAQWPSQYDIESAQSAVNITAPRGAEFGVSEMIYLRTKANSRERALALHREIFKQLELRLQRVRGEKVESMLGELQNSVTVAKADLKKATEKLQALESYVGSDLGELRALNNPNAGDGELRRRMGQLNNEIREAEAKRLAAKQQEKLLVHALADTDRLVATPNQLLEAQPALRRLKDGLVDARLRLSELRGSMSDDHPRVTAAIVAEQEVRRNLHAELETAMRGVKSDLDLTDARLTQLREQMSKVTRRLDDLAELRASYNNLVDEVAQRSGILSKAIKDLSDAKARHESAVVTSLLTPIDEPATGPNPVGPGKVTILLAGALGGGLVGLGLVFLVAPMGHNAGRRWSDRLFGRRSTDRAGEPAGRRTGTDSRSTSDGRRAGDLFAPPSPVTAVAGPGDDQSRPYGRRGNDVK